MSDRVSPGPRRASRGEDGIALLIVLLTISLLTVVVVEFTQSAQVETHFAISGRNGLQAYYLARSGVNVAEALLMQDAALNKHDALDDIWARQLPPLPVGDGTVALRVQDQGRRLNLNGLLRTGDDEIWPVRERVFERLFEVLGIDKQVLAAIIDWLDGNHEPTSIPAPGKEQPFYLGLTPPVTVRDGPMLTVRELLQVNGMTPKLFARLEEFVFVVPPDTPDYRNFKINVNTARAEVLYALSDGLLADPGVVRQLTDAQREKPFTSLSAVNERVNGWNQALGGPESQKGGADFVDIASPYFRIDAVGQVNEVARGITTTVWRKPQVSRPTLKRVIWMPSTADLSLTSQPPSDFLDALPPLGGGD